MLVVNKDTTIKHSFIALGTMLFSLLCAIMIVTTCFLISEYQFFREQSKRILILQDEYQTYLQMYKETCGMDKKKKSINDASQCCADGEQAEHQFNLVNRDFLYLRDSALTFGKANNLEALLKDVYENYDEHVQGHKISSLQQARAPQRKNNNVHTRNRNNLPYALSQFSNFSLRWPINTTQFWLSSKFGPRKKKNDKAWGFHYGIDLAALKGTAVYAAAKGKIIESSYTPHGYGNSIVIEHNRRFKTRYAHLDKVFVAQGQWVHEGQMIGSVGDTGYVHGKNASHLHFEVIEFDKRINPLRNLATR